MIALIPQNLLMFRRYLFLGVALPQNYRFHRMPRIGLKSYSPIDDVPDNSREPLPQMFKPQYKINSRTKYELGSK
jgi:hypothetical protein